MIFGGIAIFFLLLSFANVKESINVHNERMTLSRAWTSLRHNRPWFVLPLIFS